MKKFKKSKWEKENLTVNKYTLFLPKKLDKTEIEELSEEVDLNHKFINLQYNLIDKLIEENNKKQKRIGLLFKEKYLNVNTIKVARLKK